MAHNNIDPYKGVGEYVSKLMLNEFLLKEIKEFLNKPNTTPLMASAEYARQKNKIAKDCWSRFCQIDQMWFLKMVEAHNLY